MNPDDSPNHDDSLNPSYPPLPSDISKLDSVQEKTESEKEDLSLIPLNQARNNQNLSRFKAQKQRHANFILDNDSVKDDKSPVDSPTSQGRFKFSRKRRESKTSNLVIENLTYKENKTTILSKDEDRIRFMNDLLEEQKKLEMSRYYYSHIFNILERNEEPDWKADPSEFTEQEDFAKLMNTGPEILSRSCFLEVVEMGDLEKLFVDLEMMDRKSLKYKIRLFYLNFRKRSSDVCKRIITHPLFELTTILVVIMNCIEIILDNSSLTGGPNTSDPILMKIDNMFFAYYITELFLKVTALGFFMNEGAYLKDGWNLLDFFIISTAIISKAVADYGINLKGLRSLRVLRPLKILASLKQLQTILESLFQALPLLADSFLILTFCYLLYALAGLQLFAGLLKKRCIFKVTGIPVSSDALCGNFLCGSDQICSKLLTTPNSDIMNFDNIFYSFLNVFQIVTVDNWTSIMYSVQKTFTNYISIYFLSLVIIGGLFLVNLTLAIIKVKFSGMTTQAPKSRQKKVSQKNVYDFLLAKEKGIWVPHRFFHSLTRDKSLSFKNLEKTSVKSAKNSKKSNNPFSMKILSQLRMEIGKIANNVSSYAVELGKVTKSLGKTVGVDKLFRAMDKLSPISFWKKAGVYDEEINMGARKLEDIEPKYLKLEIQFLKECPIESAEDISMKNPEAKKKVFNAVGTRKFGTKRTMRMNRRRNFGEMEYRIPTYVTKELIDLKRGNMYILAINKAHRKLLKSKTVEYIDLSASKINNERNKFRNKEIGGSIKKVAAPMPIAITMTFDEARKTINEKLDDLPEEKQKLLSELFNNQDEYAKLKNGKLKRNMWSGNPVLRTSFRKRHRHINKIIKVLAGNHEEILLAGFDRLLIIITYYVHRLVVSHPFNQFILTIVLMNSVLLCLEGVIDDSYLLTFNYFFTCVFTLELFFKVIGLGVRTYFKDTFNRMDCLIVVMSISEILLTIYMDTFQSLRELRSIRVFRIFRILRTLDYVQKIANFIYKSFDSFIYIAFLLMLFNFVYGLLGMDLFTNITVKDSSLRAYSFNDFSSSFMCAFDLLTLDNWSNILIVGRNSDAGIFQTAIYSISWIFIGNYILMNLFLAVLLDGLTNELIGAEMSHGRKRLSEFSRKKEREKEICKKLAFSMKTMKEEDKRISLQNNIYNDARVSTYSNDTLMTQLSQRVNSIPESKPYDLTALLACKCEFSLFLFSRTNQFRIICHRVVFNPIFETITLMTIMISSVKMIVDTYVDGESSGLSILDSLITGYFVLECMLKVIAKGFVLSKDGYLRESWNQLDFFVVVSSVVSLIVEQFSVSFLKIIKILRVMRPLRFISKNANIRLVVVALLESLQGILNVFLIIFMIFIMFASFGVSIYRNRFGYCGDVLNFNIGYSECIASVKYGPWVPAYTYNFDNIYQAMFTLLVIATYDGWIPILGVAINSNVPEEGPTEDNARNLSNVYFVLFIIVIPIFFINLFIGVIFYHFVTSEKKSKSLLLTDSQVRWVQLQKLIIQLEPRYDQLKAPSNHLRLMCYKLVHHHYFEEVILMVICGSIVNMALIYDDCPLSYTNTIALVDQAFMLIFVIEILVKLFGFGFWGYFAQRWNQFDFFIVVFGCVDLVINKFFSQQLQVFQVGPKILRAVRMLRIGRLLRLVKQFDGMLKLLQTLVFSLPMTFNVLALLLLIFFIYTIIGCSLFGDVPIDDYVNFNNFLYGMMTLFKCSTTDNWSSTMLAILYKTSYSPIYFISFIIISQFILTNLFILVLLQQFQEAETNDAKTPLQEFHEYVDKFRTAWIECTSKFHGQKMKKTYLLRFFRILDPPLGFNGENNIDIIAKFVMEMKIQGDKEGFVYFNELLFKTMRNVYGAAIFESSNVTIINELKRQEKRTTRQLALKQSRNQRLHFYKRLFRKSRASSAVNAKGRMVVVNPLEDYLYIRLCFCSWRKFASNLHEAAQRCMMNEEGMAVFDLEESNNTVDFELSLIREELDERGHAPSEIDIKNEDLDIRVRYIGTDMEINVYEDDSINKRANMEDSVKDKDKGEPMKTHKSVVLPNFIEN